MTKIWKYGNSNTQTSTGKKWEGDVIAVPKGYKTGVEYAITLSNGEVIKALAVDSTGGDSFSAPKLLADRIGGADVKIELAAAEVTAKSNIEKNFKTVSDTELAEFLNKHTSVHDLSCKACIKREAAHKDEFIKASVEQGTPAHVATLQSILNIPDKEIAANGGDTTKIAEVNKFAAAATSLQSCSILDRLKPSKVDAVIGAFSVAQSDGKAGVLPFAQVGGKIGDFNFGASLRTDSNEDGTFSKINPQFNPLEFNYQQKLENDLTIKYGLSTWINNNNYQRNPFTSTSTLSCGCTGGLTSNAVPLRDGVLSSELHEFSSAGITAEKVFGGDTFIRGSIGVPINNRVFDSELTAALAARHKFSDSLEASTSIVAQKGQMSVDAGLTKKLGKDLKLSANVYNQSGRINNVGTEVRVEKQKLFGVEKLAASLSGIVEKDLDKDQVSGNVRFAPAYQVSEHFTVGGYIYGGSKNGKAETGGGVMGSYKF